MYLDGTGEGASGFFFPICYCGEVAAYQAALRSAASYALYRKSTLARLRGLSASLSSLGMDRSVDNFSSQSIGRSQGTLGRSRAHGNGHPGRGGSSSRRGNRAGVGGASLGASINSSNSLGQSPHRPPQQRTDLGLGMSASGSSHSSGAEPQAVLLRHYSSLAPDSPIRIMGAGSLAALQCEHREGSMSMSMDATANSGVALLSDEQRARRSDLGQAIAAAAAAATAAARGRQGVLS